MCFFSNKCLKLYFLKWWRGCQHCRYDRLHAVAKGMNRRWWRTQRDLGHRGFRVNSRKKLVHDQSSSTSKSHLLIMCVSGGLVYVLSFPSTCLSLYTLTYCNFCVFVPRLFNARRRVESLFLVGAPDRGTACSGSSPWRGERENRHKEAGWHLGWVLCSPIRRRWGQLWCRGKELLSLRMLLLVISLFVFLHDYKEEEEVIHIREYLITIVKHCLYLQRCRHMSALYRLPDISLQARQLPNTYGRSSKERDNKG